MRDDCPDLTQKEIGRYKGKWDKLQMPIESIVTVALDADLNVFFSCKWYKMEFVNVWYKYVGDERVTALLEHFRDMSLSLYPEPAKRFWDRVDLEGLCEDGVNPNCRGVITPIELTAEDIEAMREDPRWSQGQQLNEETKIYGTRCIKMVRRHKSFGVLTQQVQARLWREACEEADLAQELEESLADD
ncbi:hypothetical protein CVIRNUC_004248 [Coccomyxa viridis]|uniref:Uncharacterized protein n=2 Tax=Coccomyxa viridis TaxID=1274662 RepID=A0AAV1I1S0_9CHLO|nr:hypothetical protein CVIRNUC_004248 [Coccomyxa viridis]